MQQTPNLISHQLLRKLLGFLGIFLPVILPIGVLLLSGDQMQNSISHYYYTNMRDVFVGILWAFGLFLFTYKGYDKPIEIKTFWDRISDNTITNFAGLMAICVSLFPTNDGHNQPEWIGTFHLISAGTFFIILGGTAIFIFTKSDDPAKKSLNNIYRLLGAIIWGSLLLLGVYFLWFENSWPVMTVYYVEFIMLWAFGISWLLKGKAIRFAGNK